VAPHPVLKWDSDKYRVRGNLCRALRSTSATAHSVQLRNEEVRRHPQGDRVEGRISFWIDEGNKTLTLSDGREGELIRSTIPGPVQRTTISNTSSSQRWYAHLRRIAD
jgi:hypothetical protein